MRSIRAIALAALLAPATGAGAQSDACLESGIAAVGPALAVGSAGNGGAGAAWNPDRGEFLVVWNEYADGAHRLHGQRLRPDGSAAGGEFEIAHDANAIIDPRAAAAGGHDEYLVAWQTQSEPFNGARGIVLGGDGGARGDAFVIGPAGAEPELAYVAAGGRFLFSGRGSGILAQFVALDGSLAGDPLELSGPEGSPAPNGGLAVAASGQALSMWRNQTDERLAGRRIGADGGLPDAGPVTYATEYPGAGLAAALAYRGADDRYLASYARFDGSAVEWLDVGQDGAGSAPRIVAEGAGLAVAGLAVDEATAGSALLWTAQGPGGGFLFGRLLGADGTPAGAPVPLAAGVRPNVRVAADAASGRALAVWPSDAGAGVQPLAYGCLLHDTVFRDGFDG